MSKHIAVLALLCSVVMFSTMDAPATADETKTVKAAGILFDKQDKSVTVKVDGDKETTKYAIPENADKALTASLKENFPACRVTMTYKLDGETRQLVSIKRQILKKDGTITGAVVGVHNKFWVEVKPKNGLADAFAPGGNFKDKDFMDRLLSLKEGDSVTITYTTDGERHRILTLKKN